MTVSQQRPPPMIKILLLACCLFLTGVPHAASAANADPALVKSVNAFVDGWHDDAAHARMVSFDKMAPDGVYIGTDRSELWQRDAFRAWGRKYFEARNPPGPSTPRGATSTCPTTA